MVTIRIKMPAVAAMKAYLHDLRNIIVGEELDENICDCKVWNQKMRRSK